ncbi:hypothetical protein EW146_g4174 [Bondarzewia mesenterica]|uniref:J domain-containing protein n=1 Tax=Bondarzewia mesenterica TaxID=1095465 RepID=A0A4S4LVC3_9AGAM|nr:hypothetical protein EW146_g4174 [Bondarzewia mesenterica]
MSNTDEETNPYELLGITMAATDGEIKTAYRQRSLKVHPDRNRGNPDAARQFHNLNQAYELLLDPLRRLALDAKLRVKEARKARFANYDAKRRTLVDELEERERAEEGRRMREEKEKELRRVEEEAERAAERAREEMEPPPPGDLDTTVRLKYPLAKHSDLTTADALASFLSSFGDVDKSSIILSMKPPKNAPTKPPKRAIALVQFLRIGDAFAAVCASGKREKGMEDVEISWAGGKEPPVLDWLRKKGKLGTADVEAGKKGYEADSTRKMDGQRTSTETGASTGPRGTLPQFSESRSSGTYSSFPEFVDTPPLLPRQPLQASTPAGLDYQSLTLMRLRQAERERLEREIREQEANE